MSRSPSVDYALKALFPSKDPLAVHMFRLAVLRDDLVYELANLDVDREPADADRGDIVATMMYFTKRLSVSVCAINDVLGSPEIGRFLKKQLRKDTKQVAPVHSAYKTSRSLDAQIRGMRDGVGAHALSSHFEEILSRAADVRGPLHFGPRVRDCRYELPYKAAFIASVGDFALRHDEPAKAALRKFGETLKTIGDAAVTAADGLLTLFWNAVGVATG